MRSVSHRMTKKLQVSVTGVTRHLAASFHCASLNHAAYGDDVHQAKIPCASNDTALTRQASYAR